VGARLLSRKVPPGAWAILATPFADDGSVDGESMARLAAFYRKAGERGLVVLGVMGEAAKLADEERRPVIEAALGAADGLPVIVGVSAPSHAVVRRRIDEAGRLGAAGVMLSPSAGMGRSAIVDLFAEAGRAGLPIVVQDHPASSGVEMPSRLIGDILAATDAVAAVKLEAPPTPIKAAELVPILAPRDVTLLGGLGALSLLDELDAGCEGTMTGFAFPEVLVGLVAARREGDRARARRLYEAFLPWLVFESMPVMSLGIRKAFLTGRGLISNPRPRPPFRELGPVIEARLEELLRSFPEAARKWGVEPVA